MTQGLQQFAREQHLTLSTLLQGVWALLLSRYSGQQDLVFGTVVSGRPAELVGVEQMVGLFINTLPVRVQISLDQPVLSWLHALQQQQSEQRQYEYSSLTQVQHWSGLPADTVLFESLFAYENYPLQVQQQAVGESRVRVEALHTLEQTHYPLSLVTGPGEQILLKCLYDLNRFTPETITQLLKHIHVLLQSLLHQPEQVVGTLSLLSVDELARLEQWQTRQDIYPQEELLVPLFERYAEQQPEAIALVGGTGGELQMSYGELNYRATLLASGLRQRGVEAEVRVGICVERSVEQIIGLLGILKAGGAYVPLDPAYPSARLTWVLQDAQVPVVLTQHHLLARLETGFWHCICLDSDWAALAAEPVDGQQFPVNWPEQVAYVIYTSGSTGAPKGVQISQRSLLNLLLWHQRTYGIDRQARTTQIAGPAFDASVWEIWPPLTAGAVLAFPTEEVRLSPWHLQHWLLEQQITSSFVPTPLAERLFELPWPVTMALKDLLIGGDTLHRYPPQALRCRLINHYGPTEATVVASAGQVPAEGGHEEHAPLIGGPIANTRLYVVGQGMQPVPIGVVGDLYIAGAGIARGYLGRPEWTAERFVPDPFGQEPGARLDWTGDLVRWHEPGQLEFCRRKILRSRSVACVSNWERLNASCTSSPRCVRQWSSSRKGTSTRCIGWWLMWCPVMPSVSIGLRSVRSCCTNYRITWCLHGVLSWMFYRSRPMARLTDKLWQLEKRRIRWMSTSIGCRVPRERNNWSISGGRCWKWSALASRTIFSSWEAIRS